VVSPAADLTDVHVIKGGHICVRLEVDYRSKFHSIHTQQQSGLKGELFKV